MMESLLGKCRIRVGCRPVNHVKSVILEAPAKKAHEVGVGLQHNEDGVGTHPAENLGREGAYARSILEKDSSPVPIDFGQNVVDQEPRARNQTPEHAGVLDEVTTEEQQLSGEGSALWGHDEALCLSLGSA
jgi:hypothetical protein